MLFKMVTTIFRHNTVIFKSFLLRASNAWSPSDVPNCKNKKIVFQLSVNTQVVYIKDGNY